MEKLVKNNKYIIFGIILLYLLIGPLGFPEGNKIEEFEGIMYGYYLIGLLFMTVIIIFHGKTLKEDLIEFFTKFKKYILLTIKYFFIANFAFAIFRTLTQFIELIETTTGTELIDSTFKFYPFYVFFVVILYIPFVEGIIFRKSLQEIIKNKNLFVILSGIFYAYFHIIGDFSTTRQFIALFLPFLARGLVYAYSYMKTKNVFVPIFGDLIYNSIMFIALCLR